MGTLSFYFPTREFSTLLYERRWYYVQIQEKEETD